MDSCADVYWAQAEGPFCSVPYNISLLHGLFPDQHNTTLQASTAGVWEGRKPRVEVTITMVVCDSGKNLQIWSTDCFRRPKLCRAHRANAALWL